MVKDLLFYSFAAAAMLIPTAVGAQEEEEFKLYPTSVDIYGDAMGQFADDKISKRTVTFYDQYNNPIRKAQYGRQVEQYSADPWLLMYYTKYDYDSNHLLKSTHSEKVYEYVRGEYYYKSNNDTVTYEYDGNNRLAKQTTLATGEYTTYEYDDAGQLVKEVNSVPDRFMANGGKPLITTIVYSDFAGLNLPKSVVTEGFYSTTYVTIDYDENNHKVKATTYNDEDRTEASTVEHWTWRNDSLVEYATNRVYDGVEEPYRRTVYECVNGDPTKVRTTSYYLSGDKWRREGQPQVTNYSLLNEYYLPTDLTVTPVEGKINTGELSFVAPSAPVMDGEMSFDVYRNGIHVGTVKMTDEGAFDPKTSRVKFVDADVPNGDYEYMVQTVIKSELTGDSMAYNVSNIMPTKYYVELPAVTNIRLTGHKMEGGYDYGTVSWDAPADLDPALKFEYYNIYVVGLGQANTDDYGQTPIKENNYTFAFADDVQQIYVESVYHFGRVNSDTVTIDLNVPDGISEVTQDVADGKIGINTNEITVDGVASSVLVCNVSGAVEASYANVSRVDISGLQHGTYIAIVCLDGKNVAMKFVK